MNKEIKARWIEALRSGNYEQGKYYLRRGDSYCCLGVLCDIVKDEVNYNWMPVQDSMGTLYKFDEADEILPKVVADYADLQLSPKIEIPSSLANFVQTNTMEIAVLNDSEDYSFDELADLIEKHF